MVVGIFLKGLGGDKDASITGNPELSGDSGLDREVGLKVLGGDAGGVKGNLNAGIQLHIVIVLTGIGAVDQQVAFGLEGEGLDGLSVAAHGLELVDLVALQGIGGG